MRYKGYVMNDNQIIITYGIARNTSSENQRITYFVYTIPEENTENLDWLHPVLYTDPIIPCEIEAKAEQALTRHLRKNPKYQHRNIIFKRNNQGKHAISGIEDVDFQWHTTRQSSWEEKTQELEKFLLHVQYHITDSTCRYRLCSDLEIIPTPLTSVKPVLIQFKGVPEGRDLVRRQYMIKFFGLSRTTLDTWKREKILVSDIGTKKEAFYRVSKINESFQKQFYSKKLEDKKRYKKFYKFFKYYREGQK